MTRQREGIRVRPVERLGSAQVARVDALSRVLLETRGLLCYNPRAADVYRTHGAAVSAEGRALRVRIPSALVDRALSSTPARIVLGARNPDHRLILDADEPRVRFGSGSETNVWLDLRYEGDRPVWRRLNGSVRRLCRAAHLCEHLEHLDFFIRCVNIRDRAVTADNKDVNKFLASLNNTTRHVQAGLTSLAKLDTVLRMGAIVAGGEEAFAREPLLSFICCAVKSPLQMVEDTADTFMAISQRRMPVVISSCPMGGATGPFDEFGMVALINAELLAGIVLNQLVAPGAPILYGAVPVRTRLDNLNDMYGAPEFNHYNMACAQMARFYRVPCYSTAGVADAARPGIQATVEKLMTLMSVPRAGAQYIHYAFGLLERTNTFSPEQAVMDNAHIGIVKHMLAEPCIPQDAEADVLGMMDEVLASDHRTFIYHLPLPSRDPVYVRYPLEGETGDALREAHRAYRAILDTPSTPLPVALRAAITRHIPGVLDAVWTPPSLEDNDDAE